MIPYQNYLPGGAAQVGNTFDPQQAKGDIRTPLYPAKPYTFRNRELEELRETSIAPDIPAMPIGPYFVADESYEVS